MRPARTVALSPLALVVSLLALVLTVGSTAYAAGLAANSVGTAQLKNGAVTTAKLKANAVTGAKIKPRSVAAGDLATGVVAPRSITVSRDLPFGQPTTVFSGQGTRWVADCDEPTQSLSLTISDTDPSKSALESSGTSTFRDNGVDVANTSVGEVVDSMRINADPSFDSPPAGAFDGMIRSGSHTMRAFAIISVAATAKPCQVRIFLTPVA